MYLPMPPSWPEIVWIISDHPLDTPSWTFALQGVIEGPAIPAAPGNMSETQNLRPHTQHPKSESAFLMNPWVLHVHFRVWEVQSQRVSGNSPVDSTISLYALLTLL